VNNARSQASGFLYHSPEFIVTSAHVVIGASTILVNFPSGDASDARPVKWDLEHDLALLHLSDPASNIQPIARATEPPMAGDRLKVLGYPLGVPVVSSNQVSVRDTGGAQLRDIIDQRTREELQDIGFSILLDCPILDLEGTLVPGHSGAPILDGSGLLVGIGDGGLEQGAAARSWAIPAKALDALMEKPDSDQPPPGWPSSSVVKSLFGAELDARYAGSNRQEIKISTNDSGSLASLVLARTRTFSELQETCDDQLGLSQLRAQLYQANMERMSMGSEVIDPAGFEYDIYQDIVSGASFAVPKGSQLSKGSALTNQGNLMCVSNAEGTLLLRFQLQHTPGPNEAANLSNIFFNHATSDLPVQWQVDPRFSQPIPVSSPLGFAFRRTSWFGFEPNLQGFPQLTSYAFLLTAVRGSTVLGAIAVNRAVDTGQLKDKNWIQMHFGIQLTGFSHAPGQ